MARPRKPTSILEQSGAYKKNPQRKLARIDEPVVKAGLGEPPAYFDAAQRVVWEEIKAQASWLTEADALIVELASVLMSRFRENPAMMDSANLGQLKNFLSLMGLTPSDRSKIAAPKEKEETNRFAKRAAQIKSNVLPFKK